MFVFESTEDGSPTVRIQKDDGSLSEAMHSLKGAFSETIYVYGRAISTCIANGFKPHFLSMGLGLGYVEILTSALLLKADVPQEKIAGISFEIIPELRSSFQSWLSGQSSPLNDTYSEILRRTTTHLEMNEAEVFQFLGDLIKTGRWQIFNALTEDTEFNMRYGCICFDAFSSKTTPDLWTESFLKSFLAKTCENSCVLSTYACTGALKRALRENDFSLEIREGFASKRDSTFAVRM